LNILIDIKDSMDFEEQLEPIREEFENKAKDKRKNPVTGV
jgi:hypothetical protein